MWCAKWFHFRTFTISCLRIWSALCNKTLQGPSFCRWYYLSNFSHSIKKMNKQVQYDLKNLNNWLNANKICVNDDKTEVVLFKWLTKQTDSDLHIKLNGKRIYPTDSVKYLGIVIDRNLDWHHQISNVAAKLNRANAMLSKIRHFVNFDTLKSIYHAILEPYLNYSLTVWVQNANLIKKLLFLQKKPLRIMHFLKRNA